MLNKYLLAHKIISFFYNKLVIIEKQQSTVVAVRISKLNTLRPNDVTCFAANNGPTRRDTFLQRKRKGKFIRVANNFHQNTSFREKRNMGRCNEVVDWLEVKKPLTTDNDQGRP